MKVKISNQATIKRASEQISCDLSGEAVILSLKSGTYYGLDEIGALVWNLIERPKTFEEIYNSVMNKYNTGLEHLENDLVVLLEDLEKQGLVEIKNETSE